jgi:hypothetical protein
LADRRAGRRKLIVGQHVLQPHEGDEPDELRRRTAQADLASVAVRGELKSRERVDRHGVGLDAADVTQRHVDASPCEQRADPIAEPRQVRALDRATDGEGDGARRRKGHRDRDSPAAAKSPVHRPISSRQVDGLTSETD